MAFSSPLNPQGPSTFTYRGQVSAGGPIEGGVLIGDFVNNSAATPAGSTNGIPTSTLSGGVPVSAQLELQSTSGSLLIMRMTTAQRNLLTKLVDGMMIFNKTTVTFQFYQGSAWVSLSAGAGGVVGPGGGSTDNAIARWDGAGGATLQDSVVIVGDTGAITGVLTIAADTGSAAAPTYNFTGDVDTGVFRVGANQVGIAANGALVAAIATTGVAVTGLISATTSIAATTTVTAGTGITATTGNIVASTGNITSTLGSVSAATTVTAGTGITATTGNIVASTGNITSTLGSVGAATTVTAGTGITATTGNVTATAGNVVAGSSGNAGTVTSFPATAANGSLILSALNAGGAFNTTIRNSVMGQSTVYSLGDIGAAAGGIPVATSVFVMKSVAGAAAAGGGATQSFTDAFCTAGSNVIGNWNTQTNAVQVLKIVPGNGSFVVTSTADAGVGTFNYIITK